MKIYAFAILALKEGNAWCQGEYDEFFGAEENVRFLAEERDGREDLRGSERREEGFDGLQSGIMRRTTVAMEEGQSSAHDAIVPTHLEHSTSSTSEMASFKDWFDAGTRVPAQKLVIGFRDARFRKNLEQAQDFETGPSFRMMLWFPMVQGLAKATMVSGAPFTMAIGVVYLVSFLTVEGLLFAVRRPLSAGDRAKAMKLLREWEHSNLVLLPTKNIPAGPNIGKLQLKPSGPRRWINLLEFLGYEQADAGTVWLISASISNLALLFSILNFNPFVELWGIVLWMVDITWSMHSVLKDLYWWMWPWYFFVVTLGVYVQLVTILIGFYVALVSLALVAYSPLWIAIGAVSLVEAFQYRYSKPVDLRVLRFGPAVAAIFTASLALVAYFDLGMSGGLSYDCMTTEKKRFYDLLG